MLGNGDPVDAQAPNYARDAAGLTAVLVQGHASAYFYDSPGENRSDVLGSGPNAVPMPPMMGASSASIEIHAP